MAWDSISNPVWDSQSGKVVDQGIPTWDGQRIDQMGYDNLLKAGVLTGPMQLADGAPQSVVDYMKGISSQSPGNDGNGFDGSSVMNTAFKQNPFVPSAGLDWGGIIKDLAGVVGAGFGLYGLASLAGGALGSLSGSMGGAGAGVTTTPLSNAGALTAQEAAGTQLAPIAQGGAGLGQSMTQQLLQNGLATEGAGAAGGSLGTLAGVGTAGGAVTAGAGAAGGTAGGLFGGATVGSVLPASIASALPAGLANMGVGSALSGISGIASLYNAYSLNQTMKDQAAAADPNAPYRAGYAAQLNQLMQNPNSITSMPGYQAGMQAVERSQASQGYQGSGNMASALQTYGGQFYQQQVQNLSSLSGGTPGGGAQAAYQGAAGSANLISSGLAALAYGQMLGK